jgi:nucleotide-binding universal stress UspA family protein
MTDSKRSDDATLRAGGIEADHEVVDRLNAADSLIEVVSRDGASLSALATHGRRGVARVALGRVTSRVVRYAPVPVIVVCPH